MQWLGGWVPSWVNEKADQNIWEEGFSLCAGFPSIRENPENSNWLVASNRFNFEDMEMSISLHISEETENLVWHACWQMVCLFHWKNDHYFAYFRRICDRPETPCGARKPGVQQLGSRHIAGTFRQWWLQRHGSPKAQRWKDPRTSVTTVCGRPRRLDPARTDPYVDRNGIFLWRHLCQIFLQRNNALINLPFFCWICRFLRLVCGVTNGFVFVQISDRSEALAHQRLAAHLLAKRTKELEEKLTAITETEDVWKECHNARGNQHCKRLASECSEQLTKFCISVNLFVFGVGELNSSVVTGRDCFCVWNSRAVWGDLLFNFVLLSVGPNPLFVKCRILPDCVCAAHNSRSQF